MREHELDLIAALAEGRLEDESDARALLESSEEARRELAAQLSAIEALRSVGRPELTDAEKASLRRDIWTELRSEAAPASRPWYLRLSYGMAALFVLVALGAVVTQAPFLTGSDEAADVTEALDAPQTAPPPPTLAGDDDAEAAEEAADRVGAEGDTAQALPAPAFESAAEQLRAEGAAGLLPLDIGEHEARRCLAEAGVPELDPAGISPDAPGFIVGLSPDEEPGPGTEVAFVDQTSCELAHRSG